jgi:hypothetical protein
MVLKDYAIILNEFTTKLKMVFVVVNWHFKSVTIDINDYSSIFGSIGRIETTVNTIEV